MKRLIFSIILIHTCFTNGYADNYDECISLIKKLVTESCLNSDGSEECIKYGHSVQAIGPEALFQIFPKMCRKIVSDKLAITCIKTAIIENNIIEGKGCSRFAPHVPLFKTCENSADHHLVLACYMKSIDDHAFKTIYAE